MRFQRIQFTPDLLPADIVGTRHLQPGAQRVHRPRRGPIFANLVLADEINRAPAKVQSALLEAMQERQVTIGDTTYPLPDPFLVLATQNPIEQEGTYPLPEAQLDRFMLMIKVGYPTQGGGARDHGPHDRAGARSRPSRWPSPEQIADARAVHRPDLHRREDQGLHRQRGARDARAQGATAWPSWPTSSSTAPARARRST